MSSLEQRIQRMMELWVKLEVIRDEAMPTQQAYTAVEQQLRSDIAEGLRWWNNHNRQSTKTN